MSRSNEETAGRGKTEPSPYMTVQHVCEMLHVTRCTIERWVRAGKFPKPLRVGDYRLLFVRTEVQAHMDSLPRFVPEERGDK